MLGGNWVGEYSRPGLRPPEINVGTFGDQAAQYLLVERFSYLGKFTDRRLSAIYYAADCKAFEMLSIDRLGTPEAVTTNDCHRSFPIEFQPDGSIFFQYRDWNREIVSVSVHKDRWDERRDSAGRNDAREIHFIRLTKAAGLALVR